MTEKDFISKVVAQEGMAGQVTFRSPSNIALVKYWGKKEGQIPANPSISFTLEACATTTCITYKKLKKSAPDFSFELLFEGRQNPEFRPKIQTFLSRIYPYMPFLKDFHFVVETSNSFPHSSGIASSASGMSALALCFMELERRIDPGMGSEFFQVKASFLARLGSGSAARSIEGPVMQWGYHEGTEGSSDYFAIPYPYPIHEVFNKYQDTILMVDKGRKRVSSTLGHDLMHDHPFAEQRFMQAHTNLSSLGEVLAQGNLDGFIEIVESEALTLHAMMMASMPYFILMKPNTLEIIDRIWEFRATSNTHVCFTLDAGANVHVLYPESEKEKVLQFIKDELIVYCENRHYICDQIGTGAVQVNGTI